MRITQDAYPYLVAQRGALDDMKGDPSLWCERYSEMLDSEFACFEPYLPKACDSILDIGGGMGGIDVLLNDHYGGHCSVTLLDGVNDPPEMTHHRETFSNFVIACEFLKANGVNEIRSIDPGKPLRAPHFFDLIVSLKSWCFHYEPDRYLDFVKGCVIKGQTQLIVDVRRDKPEWERTLERAFDKSHVIFQGAKFNTFWLRA